MNLLAHSFEIFTAQLDQLIGVERFSDFGETDDVGEEDTGFGFFHARNSDLVFRHQFPHDS